jgi:hypothetical protein
MSYATGEKLNEGIAVQSIVHALADNNYVVALANFGSIIALLVLVVGFSVWMLRFLGAAYRQNVRAALYRVRRRSVMQAERAANDLHTFVGLLALHTLALFASLMTVIFAFASVMLVALHPEMDKSLLRMPTLIMYFPTLLLSVVCFLRVVHLARNTLRIRRKAVRRAKRARMVARPIVPFGTML